MLKKPEYFPEDWTVDDIVEWYKENVLDFKNKFCKGEEKNSANTKET